MEKRWIINFLVAAAVVFFTTTFLRLLYILPSIHPTKPHRRKRGTPARLLVVLGSGGHTAEMLRLLHDLDTSSYTHRSYVVGEGDDFSASKAHEFEKLLATQRPQREKSARNGQAGNGCGYDICIVPRARKIHQSLLTTPVSALRCLFACFAILRSRHETPTASRARPDFPDLILTNGPGTAVCVVLAALVLRFLAVRGTNGKLRTIYVESWARVRRLSLSGKILLGVVDRFVVQWKGLRGVGGRAEYLGVLVS